MTIREVNQKINAQLIHLKKILQEISIENVK